MMSSHKYAKTLPEAAAFAVSGGLDLEDADSSKSTAFAGLADAIRLGLLNESFVDASVSRLMFVRMRASSPHSTIIAVMHLIISIDFHVPRQPALLRSSYGCVYR